MGVAAMGMVAGGGGGGMTDTAKDIAHAGGVGGSIIGNLAQGVTEKRKLEFQMRQMEKAMAETKSRALRSYAIMEESAKQTIGEQQVARATQGKIGGAGNSYLALNDTVDKMAQQMRDSVTEVGYELHNKRYEIETTRSASKNAMYSAIAKSINILDKGAGDYFKNKNKPQKGTTSKESSTDKYGSGEGITQSILGQHGG
jgi:hypothetical protein